jgi:hypothetical protein
MTQFLLDMVMFLSIIGAGVLIVILVDIAVGWLSK